MPAVWQSLMWDAILHIVETTKEAAEAWTASEDEQPPSESALKNNVDANERFLSLADVLQIMGKQPSIPSVDVLFFGTSEAIFNYLIVF